MNFITYTHKGSEIKLSLPARRVVELEMKIEAPINEKIKEFDKLTTICDFMASAIEDGSYAERSEMALDIYDEMVSQGKNLQDYQLLIVDVLSNAGFMSGKTAQAYHKAVEMQKALLAENTETIQK